MLYCAPRCYWFLIEVRYEYYNITKQCYSIETNMIWYLLVTVLSCEVLQRQFWSVFYSVKIVKYIVTQNKHTLHVHAVTMETVVWCRWHKKNQCNFVNVSVLGTKWCKHIELLALKMVGAFLPWALSLRSFAFQIQLELLWNRPIRFELW